MMRLLNLFPEHLNLNGDAGNLLVLQRRAEWGGIRAEQTQLQLGDSLPAQRPDVILVGHGSAAAWKQAYPALKQIAPQMELWLEQGTQLLAISSGYAALHGLLPQLPDSVSKTERISKFVADEFESVKLTGYRNTDLELANLVVLGNFYGSALHGPLLAKNIWLADQIFAKVLTLRPELKEYRGSLNPERFSQVVRLAKAAEELAIEQAAN